MSSAADVKPKDTSEFDFLVSLHVALTTDVGSVLGISVRDDVRTIKNRLDNEGIAFLSKTLPRYFKDILHVLEMDEWSFTNTFSERAFGLTHALCQAGIPNFLKGILSVVLNDDASDIRRAECLRGLYQICAFLYKYEFPVNLELLVERMNASEELDRELPESFASVDDYGRRVLIYAEQALREVLRDLDLQDITPHPGSGAVYPSCSPWEKYYTPHDEKMEDWYDSGEYFLPSPDIRAEGFRLDWEKELVESEVDDFVDQGIHDAYQFQDNPSLAKLTGVPKDIRGPRMINVENSLRMRIQQGQRGALYDFVEKHPILRGHVNFTDQTINARLALSSSVDRKFATLDMKDASDRVSLALVRSIWPTRIVRQLEASRTEVCDIPNVTVRPGVVIPGRSFRMRKFAPMGSAVCFPVEALTFWALSVSALSIKYSRKTLAQVAKSVFVYGDDIIVPSEDATCVRTALELFALKFNADKCFEKGFFRESCGTDAYRGQVVTPIRLKKSMPKDESAVENLVSWISLADSLYERGYTRAAWLMVNHVERILGALPYSPVGAFLGWRNSGLVSAGMVVKKERDSLMVENRNPRFVGPIRPSPWYGGMRMKVWKLTALKHVATEEEFSEVNRYLRWFEPKRQPVAHESSCDRFLRELDNHCKSNEFVLRRTLALKKGWTLLT